MEIINIEAHTFEAMLGRFESFVQKAEKLASAKHYLSLPLKLDHS